MREAEGDTTRIEEEEAIQVQRPKLELCSHMPGGCEDLLGDTRNWKRPGGIFLQSLWREHSPADTLIWDFWPPEL